MNAMPIQIAIFMGSWMVKICNKRRNIEHLAKKTVGHIMTLEAYRNCSLFISEVRGIWSIILREGGGPYFHVRAIVPTSGNVPLMSGEFQDCSHFLNIFLFLRCRSH